MQKKKKSKAKKQVIEKAPTPPPEPLSDHEIEYNKRSQRKEEEHLVETESEESYRG